MFSGSGKNQYDLFRNDKAQVRGVITLTFSIPLLSVRSGQRSLHNHRCKRHLSVQQSPAAGNTEVYPFQLGGSIMHGRAYLEPDGCSAYHHVCRLALAQPKMPRQLTVSSTTKSTVRIVITQPQSMSWMTILPCASSVALKSGGTTTLVSYSSMSAGPRSGCRPRSERPSTLVSSNPCSGPK